MRPYPRPGSTGCSLRPVAAPQARHAAATTCVPAWHAAACALLLGSLALGGCDLPAGPRPAAAVAPGEPLRGQYGLAAPVGMADGRTLYWAQLSFWGKRDPSEGQDTWTGTYSVKDGGGCLAGVAWGTFLLAQGRVETGSIAFSDVVLGSGRRTLEATIVADGTPVRVHLVLDAPSPL